jgi:hypothetical protein
MVRSILIAQIDNQQSSGVVTVRVERSIQSLLHQRRDLHQSTYLYLLEDWGSTFHKVVSNFRLHVRYYHVSSI